ncbi:hypothetical protein ACIGFK_39975 [Streptomyces sp. NPDC085524]|uniref:hypothetical protein n=1 Tax=Streptomyces sp. NPDC085524 TaxID=3365728 RepID=UPI0037D142D9
MLVDEPLLVGALGGRPDPDEVHLALARDVLGGDGDRLGAGLVVVQAQLLDHLVRRADSPVPALGHAVGPALQGGGHPGVLLRAAVRRIGG